jgi:hypothetical protein
LNSGKRLADAPMVGNQLRQGLMMLNNEEIVRELYAAADGSGKETHEAYWLKYSESRYRCIRLLQTKF